MLLPLLLLLLLTQVVAHAPAVELTDENFDDNVLLRKKEMWLVMFYAPWCGHCKHLKPVFDEAAPKARSYGMRMGKMDATASTTVAKRYEVKGYPTLLYYRENQPQKYRAGRNVEGFLEFAKVMKKDPVQQAINQHTLDAAAKKRPVTFFLGQPNVKDPLKSELYHTFHKAAHTLQDQFNHIGFAAGGDQDDVVLKSKVFPTEHSYLVRVETGEAPRYYADVDSEELTVEQLIQWMEYERHPIFSTLSKDNFYTTSHSKQKAYLAVSVVNTLNAPESARIKQEMHALARAARPASDAVYQDSASPTFLYGWLDGIEYKDFLEQYGIAEQTLPQVIVFDAPTERYFHEFDVPVNAKGVSQFIQDG